MTYEESMGTPPPAPEASRQPETPRHRGGKGIVVLTVLAAFVLGFAAGGILLPLLQPRESEGLAKRLDRLEEQLSSLRTEFSQLREELSGRMESLAGRLAGLPESVAQAVQEAAPTRAPSPETAGHLPAVGPDDDPALGREDAPVVIIEFSDFQCPFCKRFAEQTFPQIKRDYIDTGKVRFVFRDFPIMQIHPNAGLAALAAECADEQGKFWEMHDLLFARQSEWAGSAPGQAQSLFEAYARELGLADPAFSECLSSQRYADEVVKDLREGAEAGVRGTPAFFINGEKIEGAYPYEKFREVIERALAAAEN